MEERNPMASGIGKQYLSQHARRMETGFPSADRNRQARFPCGGHRAFLENNQSNCFMAKSTRTEAAVKPSTKKKPAKKSVAGKSQLSKAVPVKPQGKTVEDYILAQPPDAM